MWIHDQRSSQMKATHGFANLRGWGCGRVRKGLALRRPGEVQADGCGVVVGFGAGPAPTVWVGGLGFPDSSQKSGGPLL